MCLGTSATAPLTREQAPVASAHEGVAVVGSGWAVEEGDTVPAAEAADLGANEVAAGVAKGTVGQEHMAAVDSVSMLREMGSL